MKLGWPFGKKQQKEVREIFGIDAELTREELNLLAQEDEIRKELDELENQDKAIEGQLAQTRGEANLANEKGNYALAEKLMAEYEELSKKAEKNLSNEMQKNHLRAQLNKARMARIKKGMLETVKAYKAERAASS